MTTIVIIRYYKYGSITTYIIYMYIAAIKLEL